MKLQFQLDSTSKLFHVVLVLSNDEGMCLCLFMKSRKWTFEGMSSFLEILGKKTRKYGESTTKFQKIQIVLTKSPPKSRVSEVFCFCSLGGKIPYCRKQSCSELISVSHLRTAKIIVLKTWPMITSQFGQNPAHPYEKTFQTTRLDSGYLQRSFNFSLNLREMIQVRKHLF